MVDLLLQHNQSMRKGYCLTKSQLNSTSCVLKKPLTLKQQKIEIQ